MPLPGLVLTSIVNAPQTAEPHLAVDCCHFLSDRPCGWHKKAGLVCRCEHYKTVSERVLIIKLDAMGDVLRTTALLPLLAQAHPQATFCWLTRAESEPLLRHNPYLTEVLILGGEALAILGSVRYDRVVNLDAGRPSAALASLTKSPRKDGYVLHEDGVVRATNGPAQRWLEMGVRDDLKRSNTRTYQEHMCDILGLPLREHDYVLELKPDELARAASLARELGLDPSRPVIGLNTGAGGRWKMKQWREAGFSELCDRLDDALRGEIQLLLLGGGCERERNRRIRQQARARVFDPGCDHAVRDFCALVDLCDVVVSGDTLAMHIALARKRRVVVIFGPTSASEIELYGRGEKVTPGLDCLCCYKLDCDFVPLCVDAVTVEMVEAAVVRQLQSAREMRSPVPR